MLALLASVVLSPQAWLVDTNRRPAIVAPKASDSAMLDVDRDGDPDLLISESTWPPPGTGGLRLWLNDGVGRFTDATATRVPAGNWDAYSLAIGDVDADGDQDVVLGCIRDPLRLYLNDGTGRFSDATASAMPATAGAMRERVHLFDVDGDGDLDLYAAGQQPAMLYPNDGTGNFARLAAQPSVPSDLVGFIVEFDLEGDGDRDLLVGNFLRILENRGGMLHDTGFPVAFSRHAAAGDVDGDGDADVVLAQDGFDIRQRQDQLLLNDGTGRFQLAPMPFDADLAGFVRLADLDRDGDLDIFVDNRGQSRVLVNVGGGRFLDATATRLPFIENSSDQLVFRAHAADLDGDSDLDVVHTTSTALGRCETFWNRGDGTFFATGPFPPGHWGPVRGTADVDGDGAPDRLGVEIWTSTPIRAYRNDGRGRFADPPLVVTTGYPPPRTSTGDIDRDGDDDLLLCDAGVVRLLHNQNGLFVDATAQRLPSPPPAVNVGAFHDLDGDGHVELVLGAARVHVFRNDRTGRFLQEMPVLWTDRPIVALAFGDLDRSGSVDIAACGGLGFDYILLNNGGTFVLRRLPYELTLVEPGVALLDVDLDGDLDLVRGGLLSLNDGAGGFAPGTGLGAPQCLAAGDVDGDGAADLVTGDALGATLRLASAGGLRSGTLAQPPFANLAAVFLADVDADGDLDLDVSSAPGDAVLLLNQSRHVYARSAPRIGRQYDIEIVAMAGSATLPRTAVLLVADAAARVLLPPYGVLGVDLTRAVVLPPVFLAAGVPGTQVSAVVPNVTGLLGVTLYLQAGIADAARGLRLSNTFTDVIQ